MCTSQKIKAQFGINFFSQPGFNCVANLPNVSYTISSNGVAVGPYTFTFFPFPSNTTLVTVSGTATANTGTVNNVPVGNYSVTVMSANSIVSFFNLQITNAAYAAAFSTFNVINNVTCNGGSNGNVLVNPPSSFSTGCQFLWSPSSFTTQNNSNLSAGIVYSVTVTDSQGCNATNTVSVTEPPPISSVSSNTLFLCFGTYSTIITTTGGVAPYSYTLNGVPTSSLATISAGIQTLVTQDANACLKTTTLIGTPFKINTTVLTHSENCSAADGAFTLNVLGGTPNYTYSTLPGAFSSSLVTNVSSGTYTTMVKDANNCKDSIVFTLGNLSIVSLSISSSNSVSCYNNCNGSVTLSIQNATQPITYSATSTPTTNSNIISGLCAGFYNIYAIDANGCPATTTLNFPSPVAFSYSAANPPLICYGKQASLSASANGGSGGYNFVWNPGSISGQSVMVSPIATTVYSLNVYDSKGCTLAPYTITVSVNPQISIAINSSGAGICPGSTAQITPTVSGGDGNYNYTWLPGNTHSSSIFLENASTPVFSLIVNDVCGSPTAYAVIPIKIFPIIQPIYSTSGVMGCAPYCVKFINRTKKSKNAIWNFGDKPFEQLADTVGYCYLKEGKYNLRLSLTDSNLCKASYIYNNAITVFASPKAEFITEPNIISLANAQDVLIKNSTSDAHDFEWFLNKKSLGKTMDINYTFSDTGCYKFKLLAKNLNGCADSVEKNICVKEGFHFFMPTSFTPNRDKLNDILIPQGTGWQTKNYVFEVFNRWGNRIFKTNDPSIGWDGGLDLSNTEANGYKSSPNDTYIWHVLITDELDKTHNLKGFVALMK